MTLSADEFRTRLPIDLTQRSTWASCPWCGQFMAMGYSKEHPAGTQLRIVHRPEPKLDGSYGAGCDAFVETAAREDFVRILLGKGVRFVRLDPMLLDNILASAKGTP
jgi:hypothetical protein